MTVAAIAMVAMKFFDVAIKAYCDTVPVFEAAEHALDDITLLVDCGIKFVVDPAVTLVQDDGLGASFSKPCP